MTGGSRSTTASRRGRRGWRARTVRQMERRPVIRPGGGESLAAVGSRVRQACDDLWSEAGEHDVVVVTHVSPIKAAVAWALGVRRRDPVADVRRPGVDQPHRLRAGDRPWGLNCPASAIQRHLPPTFAVTGPYGRDHGEHRAPEFLSETVGHRSSRAPVAGHGGRRAAAVAPGVSTLLPVYIDRAEGAVLVDVDGNCFIDLGSGIAVTSIGHAVPAGDRGHPRADAAVFATRASWSAPTRAT